MLDILIIILSVCGFCVAKHIRDHKVKKTPLICARPFDCHAVVHSGYSKFLGMSVETFGMAYYAFIALAYLLFLCMPQMLPAYMHTLMSYIVVLAFMFSLYLISVQIFILKKACSWCMISALISAVIFVLVFYRH